MANGRIRRSARRGIAVAVLGWLCVAAASVVLAPAASAAKAVTVEIKNVTPPAASVDKGGTVTFVNKIPAQNKSGISIPLVGSVTATVYTDVSVTFFGQQRKLAPNQTAQWTFDAPATTGMIAYTYRVVPQAGLSATVVNQVVDTVTSQLPKLPAPTPYVVQTIAPAVPNAPSVNVPQLPTIEVPDPTAEAPAVEVPSGDDGGNTGGGTGGETGGNAASPDLPDAIDGERYTYGSGAAPQGEATSSLAARAFDPARFPAVSSADRSAGGSSSGSGGVPGGYDGASVPVFGELAGMDGAGLDEESADEDLADSSTAAQTLPAAALAAVIALATVTAALVQTHRAHRTDKR